MNRTRSCRHELRMAAALWTFVVLQTISLVHAQTLSVPAPSGPFHVGSSVMVLSDSSRQDPFANPAKKRELLVRFWYPAVLLRPCKPAEYVSPKVWSYLSTLTGNSVPAVQTNSCWNAPASLGLHPVILATPGYTALFTDYTFLFEELASHGYFVISIAHPYETSAVEFPHGELITSFLGTHLIPESLRSDLPSINLARTVRVSDIKFVLGELLKLNSNPAGPFRQRLDIARIGILGHSLGGDVALISLQQQSLLKTAIVLEPVISPDSARGTSKPVLIIDGGRTSWQHSECKMWNNLMGPHLAVSFPDAGHDTPSDAVWLAPYFPTLDAGTGSLGRDETIMSIRRYMISFFDTYLREMARSNALNGLPSNTNGAIVTTSQRMLCDPRGVQIRMTPHFENR